tara:strand:+ start:111 stop:899 length:789 start_codon:yes stop_codon:yes gene_type:complete
MATIDLGKIKLVWRGTYNNSTAYTVDDVVEYTDSGITSTYICVANSTGNAPSSSGTAHASWNYMAKGVADPIPSQSGNAGKILETNGSALSFVSKPIGIAEADQWRLNTSESFSAHQGYNWGNANILLDANWERNDTYFDKIGTGLTESSGVFTFPSTGIYNIRLQYGGRSNSADSQWIAMFVAVSTDSGSNWTNALIAEAAGIQNTGAWFNWHNCAEVTLDVTNASTFRMRFEIEPHQAIVLMGMTNQMRTGFTCTRLGDT